MSTDIKQPLPVQGYKPQSQATIDLVNEGKELEERVMRYLEKVERSGKRTDLVNNEIVLANNYDLHWLAVGRTDIQKGFMAAFRAVFQPKRAKLPEDSE